MYDLKEGRSRAFDELGLEVPFAELPPAAGVPYAAAEHFAFAESPFAELEEPEAEALAWHDLEAEEEESAWRDEGGGEGEWLDEDEEEEEELEDLNAAGSCLAQMKFEFQTRNKLHRNDGKATSQLKRKYGPDDFLTRQDGARLESESDANGVVEFETEWFRKWPKLEKAIRAAVKMTEDMSAAPSSRFNSARRGFPFDIAHLRKATASEKAQGYWNARPGKEGKKEKPLAETEELEVEIVDLSWTADIQSSESMLLEHYESLLVQHEVPTLVTDTLQHADALLQISNSQPSAARNGKLRNFLLIVTNYILRGQRISVNGTYPKANFRLMNRTNFASIYSKLLPSVERQIFFSLVTKKLILKELGLTSSTRFFKEGYGEKTHFDGPTVNAWLQGIVGGKDLLAAGQSPGLSASMGRYKVETLANQKDRWLVKFEVRGTVMGRTKASKDWLSYASTLFDLACKREVSAIELLIKQGVTDDALLTDYVFHARHAELQGRKIRSSETNLVDEWKAIKSKVIQPLLPKPQPELPEYGTTHEAWISGEDEADLYASDWEAPVSDEDRLGGEAEDEYESVALEAFGSEDLQEALFENESDEATEEFGRAGEDEWLDAGELEWSALRATEFESLASELSIEESGGSSPEQVIRDFVEAHEAEANAEKAEFEDEIDAGLRAKSKFLTLLPHSVEINGTDIALIPTKMDPGFYEGLSNYKLTESLQLCLSAVMKNSKFANIKVALVDLSKDIAKPEFAGHKHKEQVFIASVAKIAVMAAAFQLQHDLRTATKRLKSTNQADLFSKMRDEWAATQAINGTTKTDFTARIRLQGRRVLIDRNSIALSAPAFRSPKLETIFSAPDTGNTVLANFRCTKQNLATQRSLVKAYNANPKGISAKSKLLALGFWERLGIAIGGNVPASNLATGSVVRDLGYHYIASFLLQSGLYDPARGGGLWLGRDFDTNIWRGAPGGGPGQSGTAGSVAAFMTLLVQERLVGSAASKGMGNLLEKVPASTVPSIRSQFDNALKGGGRSIKRLHSKLGLIPNGRSQGYDEVVHVERDVVQNIGGKTTTKIIRYVAVILRSTTDALTADHLIVELDNCIIANNGISVSQLVPKIPSFISGDGEDYAFEVEYASHGER